MTYDWSPTRVRPYVVPPTRPPEPWRAGPWVDLAVQVDLGIIRHLAWPDRLALIERDEREYLVTLAGQVRSDGPEEPMLIVLDDHGRAGLQQGHHRLLTAEREGRTHWPVRFEYRSGKLRYGADLSKMLPIMLRSAKK